MPAGGGGAGAPTVGIKPADTGIESAHVRAIVITNRFMDVSFEVLSMQDFLHQIL
jgi:hypothetical protein